jgi:hypothetical protein
MRSWSYQAACTLGADIAIASILSTTAATLSGNALNNSPIVKLWNSAPHVFFGLKAVAHPCPETGCLALPAASCPPDAALATLGAMFIHRITQTGLSGRGAWPWRSCLFALA